MRPLLALALAAALSACGTPAEEPAAAPSSTAVSAPTDAMTSEPTSAATTTTAAVGLEPEGLVGVVDEDLLFGAAPRKATVAAVRGVLGPPTSRESGMECGPGPLDAASWQGLDLYFLDGTLAGWYLQAPAPDGAIVAGGIVPGSTLEDLQNAYGDVTVEGSTLGNEWSGGALSGTLDDSGVVEVIWAGATCIAR